MSGCSDNDSKHVGVDSVSIDKASNECFIGDEFTLTVTILPANAEDKTVTWTSSDNTKATVDKNTGKVKALAEGDVTITVTSNSKVNSLDALKKKTDNFELRIKPVTVQFVTIECKP
jgi:uncharacterized protein YjdB